MSETVPALVYLAAFALAALLAWAVLRGPGGSGRKVLALAVLALFIPIGLLASVEMLGRPKPATMEWLFDFRDEVEVVAHDLAEGEAIYLWLRLPGEAAPRAFALAWEKDTAIRLETALEEAEALSTPLMARLAEGEETSVVRRDARMLFYPLPQKPLPQKPDPGEDAEGYYYEADGDG